MAEMRENDIYRWHWKEGKALIVGCYSHLAVVIDGVLRDTYWHDYSTSIDPSRVDLTLLGNIDDCDAIRPWDLLDYDPADIIDMRHANNSGAAIYLKRGAVKSQKWILERAEDRLAKATREKEWAERQIVEWAGKIEKIKAGDLDGHF